MHGLTIHDGIPDGVPQMLPSPTSPLNESHVTLSQAQQASNVVESQQIILIAPPPVIPHTNDTVSTPQSLPHQIKTPELLVDKSALQQGDDDPHRHHLSSSSEATVSPKPLHRKPIMDPNGLEVEHVVSEPSSRSLPDPTGESSDSQRDVHNETANAEDSIHSMRILYRRSWMMRFTNKLLTSFRKSVEEDGT